jgi:uncharacterized protein (DUF2267 family)
MRAIQATLETLAERIPPGEASDLAAELPPELSTFLEGSEEAESFSVEAFLTRVAAKERADLPDAIYHVRAVLAVVQEAVSAQEMEQVRGRLPDEFVPLFEAGSEGEMELNA